MAPNRSAKSPTMNPSYWYIEGLEFLDLHPMIPPSRFRIVLLVPNGPDDKSSQLDRYINNLHRICKAYIFFSEYKDVHEFWPQLGPVLKPAWKGTIAGHVLQAFMAARRTFLIDNVHRSHLLGTSFTPQVPDKPIVQLLDACIAKSNARRTTGASRRGMQNRFESKLREWQANESRILASPWPLPTSNDSELSIRGLANRSATRYQPTTSGRRTSNTQQTIRDTIEQEQATNTDRIANRNNESVKRTFSSLAAPPNPNFSVKGVTNQLPRPKGSHGAAPFYQSSDSERDDDHTHEHTFQVPTNRLAKNDQKEPEVSIPSDHRFRPPPSIQSINTESSGPSLGQIPGSFLGNTSHASSLSQPDRQGKMILHVPHTNPNDEVNFINNDDESSNGDPHDPDEVATYQNSIVNPRKRRVSSTHTVSKKQRVAEGRAIQEQHPKPAEINDESSMDRTHNADEGFNPSAVTFDVTTEGLQTRVNGLERLIKERDEAFEASRKVAESGKQRTDAIEAEIEAIKEQLSSHAAVALAKSAPYTPIRTSQSPAFQPNGVDSVSTGALFNTIGEEIRKLQRMVLLRLKQEEHDQISKVWKTSERVWLTLDKARDEAKMALTAEQARSRE